MDYPSPPLPTPPPKKNKKQRKQRSVMCPCECRSARALEPHAPPPVTPALERESSVQESREQQQQQIGGFLRCRFFGVHIRI